MPTRRRRSPLPMGSPPPASARHLPRHAARRSAAAGADTGFTLVELLVVIGIIVILIAILLPTASKVRVRAQSSSTEATMASIAAAIERYHLDERAYPGVAMNAALTIDRATNTGGFKAPGLNVAGSDPASQRLTSTENMVLAMCGGFTYAPTAPGGADVDLTTVGKGPMNLSASPVKRVRHGAYIEASPGHLFPASYSPNSPGSGIINGPANPLSMPGTVFDPRILDSAAPEFVDDYSQQRAIVYLRAVPNGVLVPVPPAGTVLTPTADNEKYDYADNSNDSKQYNLFHFDPYRREPSANNDGTGFRGDFKIFTNSSDPDEYSHSLYYIKSPMSPNAPRGKDKFLLFSAGPDRRYCTTDDIIVGG
ncbi:MAG: hypothetical protein JWO31_1619 [Phycisphaerales bacterium]|nr:hypothetical protein [Phycisphaerales bacterium]